MEKIIQQIKSLKLESNTEEIIILLVELAFVEGQTEEIKEQLKKIL